MSTQPAFFGASYKRSGLRLVGLVLALACTVLPALPLGPLVQQPPIPVAALWAAYGWAADGDDSWRAPVSLAVLGLVQDQLAGGPLGFYVVIFVSAYFIGQFTANMMKTANLLSPWVGFAATAFASCMVAGLTAQVALNSAAALRPFALAALVTTLLFPLVRPLYMSKELTTGGGR